MELLAPALVAGAFCIDRWLLGPHRRPGMLVRMAARLAERDAETALEDDLAYFYELRLRLRGRPEATAIIDRCISIIWRAQGSTDEAFAALEGEVEALRSELIARFGAKTPH